MQVNILAAKADSGFYSVEFARVQEASQWSVWVNILEVRADSGFVGFC